MEHFYQSITAFLKHPTYKKILGYIISYTPLILFIVYPFTLIYLFMINSPLLLETIFKPLIAFSLVTIGRKVFNRPRPYESLNIEPIYIHKTGESFPSRHTVSAFSIALAFIPMNIYLGITCLFIASIIALSRVLGGLHYLSDVLVAIIVSIIIFLI